MTDEFEGATQPAPGAGQAETDWASIEIDVPGMNKRMPLGEVVKSYPEAVNRMHEANRVAAERETMLQRYEPLNERFQDPRFQQGFQNLWDGNYGDDQEQSYEETPQRPPQRPAIDPTTAQLQSDVALMKYERAFDRIRHEGNPLDREMETEVLREKIRRPNESIEGIYYSMYHNKIVEERVRKATAEQAEIDAKGRRAYPRPPSGTTEAPTKTLAQMSAEEGAKTVLDIISEATGID